MVAILLGSDLHLEFYNNYREYEDNQLKIPDSSLYDVVVLAGDIYSGLNGVEWAKRAFDCTVCGTGYEYA